MWHSYFILLIWMQYAFAVTIYVNPSPTPLAPGEAYRGPAAFNPITLQAPAPPNNFPTQYNVQVQGGPAPPGSSIPHLSSFLGFSIEMSVVDRIFGASSHLVNVPFLNLMANLARRSGRVNIRVGGNTQDTATMVQNTTSGKLLEKDYHNTEGTTKTPPIIYKEDLLYLMANISHFVNVRWFLGIPFNATNPFKLDIAEKGQAILGDHLLGLQAGNEPDFYVPFGKRRSNYTVMDYFGEVGDLISQVDNDPLITNRTMLMAPSVSGPWTPETVWNTGLVQAYSSHLSYLTVQRYPDNNCFAQFGGNNVPRDPQQVLPNYLSHDAGIKFVAQYLNSSNFAQQNGKPIIMSETNTASCGGFNGVSDSFAAALWALDYGLQLAYVNFSMALFHVGGQRVYYNPFTAPPTNQSSYRKWTIGPIYYSALVMAETIANGSQVLDITTSANLNHQSPAYAIYDNGRLSRLALFNYVSDPSGAHDVQFTFSVGGQPSVIPAQVKSKYLRAGSITQKGNLTWAGQTFGSVFQSDGRLMGEEDIKTIQCNQTSNTCTVPVPAPSYVLVFLMDDAFSPVEYEPAQTFPTSIVTRMRNTVTVDQVVLATSNGHSGKIFEKGLGRTSWGGPNGAVGAFRGSKVASTLGYLTACFTILHYMVT